MCPVCQPERIKTEIRFKSDKTNWQLLLLNPTQTGTADEKKKRRRKMTVFPVWKSVWVCPHCGLTCFSKGFKTTAVLPFRGRAKQTVLLWLLNKFWGAGKACFQDLTWNVSFLIREWKILLKLWFFPKRIASHKSSSEEKWDVAGG